MNIMKISIRIASSPVRTPTKHLPNMSLQRCHYITSLGSYKLYEYMTNERGSDAAMERVTLRNVNNGSIARNGVFYAVRC
jgi:hypothetical protein